MGIKTKRIAFKISLSITALLCFQTFLTGAELIELNRVVAKVNERVVTWGEIENAMTLLNFTEQEKKLGLMNLLMVKLIDCSPLLLLGKKVCKSLRLTLSNSTTRN